LVLAQNPNETRYILKTVLENLGVNIKLAKDDGAATPAAAQPAAAGSKPGAGFPYE
jgi:hypothetical protein